MPISGWVVNSSAGFPLQWFGLVNLPAIAERLLAHVITTLGAAHAHHGYLFCNARASRIKLVVHDGFGVWCATRRLHTGRFVWLERSPGDILAPATLQLTAQQFEALTVGLPWQRLGEAGIIRTI